MQDADASCVWRTLKPSLPLRFCKQPAEECLHASAAARLAYPPPQVLVARRDDVAAVLRHALAEAVVGVGARVRARQPPDAGVLCDLERHPVLLAELLELRHDAGGDARRAHRVEAVHHALHQVDLQAHAAMCESAAVSLGMNSSEAALRRLSDKQLRARLLARSHVRC